MALTVNTNLASLNAQRNLGLNNSMLAKSLERLSSGLRVNRAADDAAGLSIASKLNFQARGLNQAVRNTGDATSLVQTAEGAFGVATNILGRLRELAVQAASDTNTSADRTTLKAESDLLVAELTRLANTTEFNGSTLVDGSFASAKIQAGANADQTISFSLGDMRAAQLGKFAAFSANISDGIASGVTGNGNLTAGEFTINGELVGATATTDDQVSVLTYKYVDIDITGTATSAFSNQSTLGYALAEGTAALVINGTTVSIVTNISGTSAFTGTSAAYNTGSEFASAIVAKINAAGITNVTARTTGGSTGWALVATKGTDIRLAISVTGTSVYASRYSQLGLASHTIGSITANEISNYNGQSSAIAKAAAINSVKSKSTVAATALQNDISMAAAVGAGTLAANTFYINNVAIDATASITASDGTGALRAAINAKTSSTGVTAAVNSTGYLVLSAKDGRNVDVYVDVANAASITGFTLGANLYRSSLKFVSNNAVTFTGTTTDVGSLTVNTPYTTDLNNSVSLLDISTQAGANTAITSLDAALSQVNKLRADVGALQNRLELTAQALQVSAENQTAAESRIRDADFAFETSRYTRNQVLVQAGTAILAQANSSTQIALQLLQR